ncbi:unnamed protein product [Ixodes pacificus]
MNRISDRRRRTSRVSPKSSETKKALEISGFARLLRNNLKTIGKLYENGRNLVEKLLTVNSQKASDRTLLKNRSTIFDSIPRSLSAVLLRFLYRSLGVCTLLQ